MANRLILKLKKDAPPVKFINELKELVKNDKELSQPFINCLKTLRKFRKNHIDLPHIQEVIIYPEKAINIERGLKPAISVYMVNPWTDEDKTEWKKDKKLFMVKLEKIYDLWGYYIDEQNDISLKEVETILSKIKGYKEK